MNKNTPVESILTPEVSRSTKAWKYDPKFACPSCNSIPIMFLKHASSLMRLVPDALLLNKNNMRKGDGKKRKKQRNEGRPWKIWSKRKVGWLPSQIWCAVEHLPHLLLPLQKKNFHLHGKRNDSGNWPPGDTHQIAQEQESFGTQKNPIKIGFVWAHLAREETEKKKEEGQKQVTSILGGALGTSSTICFPKNRVFQNSQKPLFFKVLPAKMGGKKAMLQGGQT